MSNLFYSGHQRAKQIKAKQDKGDNLRYVGAFASGCYLAAGIKKGLSILWLIFPLSIFFTAVAPETADNVAFWSITGGFSIIFLVALPRIYRTIKEVFTYFYHKITGKKVTKRKKRSQRTNDLFVAIPE